MWPQTLRDTLEHQACVLVTLNIVSGSAPRESGTRMIVTDSAIHGSIGGGNLEHQATLAAREMLQSAADGHAVNTMVGLGPALNQCCGGAVALRYEVFRGPAPEWLKRLLGAIDKNRPVLLLQSADQDHTIYHGISRPADIGPEWPPELRQAALDWLEQGPPSGTRDPAVTKQIDTNTGQWYSEIIGRPDESLYLFGAGHVGRAVEQVLRPLPFRVTWLDSREDIFPESIAEEVECICSDCPEEMIGKAPPGSLFLVMTHSHKQDEDICHAVLSRGEFGWLGLIGSVTKRRRFVHRLARRGIEESMLHRLICPVGLPGIHGKQPATIAVAVAAQLLAERPA